MGYSKGKPIGLLRNGINNGTTYRYSMEIDMTYTVNPDGTITVISNMTHEERKEHNESYVDYSKDFGSSE